MGLTPANPLSPSPIRKTSHLMNTHTSARRSRIAALIAAAAIPIACLATVAPAAHGLPMSPPPTTVSLWQDLGLSEPTDDASLLATDTAGDVWYYDGNGEQSLVRVDQLTHAQTVYPLPPSWVMGMVGAPDGSIWYTDLGDRTLKRLDPATGSITAYPVPREVASSKALAIGNDGAIWLGNTSSTDLARMSLTGSLTYVTDPHGGRIFDLVAGRDGRLWYTRSGTERVGVYDPLHGAFTDVGVGDVEGYTIAVGKSGGVWVGGDGLLTEIAPDGSISSHPITSPGPFPARPLDMVGGDLSGDDTGELYFVSSALGFSRVEADGSVHSSALPGFRIAVTMDGQHHLWSSALGVNSLQWN